MSDLLTNLNKEQKEAVTYTDGPLFILAGAGTGKTTLLTHRIAWLITERAVAPDNILALTFTEKAAHEMEERVDKLLNSTHNELWIQTFHSFCERILRAHAVDIGINSRFEVLNETQQWIFMKDIVDGLALNYYKPRGYPTKFIQALISHFSRCSDEGITPNKYDHFLEMLQDNGSEVRNQFVSRLPLKNLTIEEGELAVKQEIEKYGEVALCYRRYKEKMLENSYLDFGDLIVYTIELLKKRPAILAKYREQFKYILVDEFQDTNKTQYGLVKLLAQPRNNIMVVGDDDQSIYAFRGATIENIMNFTDDFPDSHTVVLLQNYRSGQSILDIAYKSISQNEYRLESKLSLTKKLESQVSYEGYVRHIHADTVDGEVHGVINEIIRLKKDYPDVKWSDIAILVRAHSNALPFVSFLENNNIPYSFGAPEGLYTQPIIIELLSYLRLLYNPHDNGALYTVLASDSVGIVHNDLGVLVSYIKRKGVTFYNAIQSEELYIELSDDARDKLKNFNELLTKNVEISLVTKPSELVVQLIRSLGILERLTKEETVDNLQKLGYIEKFYKKLIDLENKNKNTTVKNILEHIDLEMEAGDDGLAEELDGEDDSIVILSIHGSKGLEFPYVFIINLVQQRFPTNNRSDIIKIPDELLETKSTLDEKQQHIEEERRLFYVGLTRAKEGLYLCSADNYGGVRKKKLSRFLTEIDYPNDTTQKHVPDELVKQPQVDDGGRDKVIKFKIPKKFSFTQLSEFDTCPLKYKYKYLLNIKTPATPNLSFGSSIHNTLESFFSKILANKSKKQESLFNELNLDDIPTENDLLAMYEDAWIDEWYQSREQHDEWKDEGKLILQDFYQNFLVNPANVERIEEPFSISIEGDSVVGRIDRVDVLGTGGRGIVDYKTGTPKKSLTKQDKRQLLLYYLASKELYSFDVEELTYHYLRDNTKCTFTPKEKDVAELIGWLKEQISNIKSSDFGPNPGMHCTFCDFRDICQYKQLM